MLWRGLLLQMTDVVLLDFSVSSCPEAGCSWEAKAFGPPVSEQQGEMFASYESDNRLFSR